MLVLKETEILELIGNKWTHFFCSEAKFQEGENAETYLEEEKSREPHKNRAGLAEWLSHATHLHPGFNASLHGQEQYNVNKHLGGLSEFTVSAQMVPTTPNLSPWGKSFPKNVFFILVQVLFSCSLHLSSLGTHFILVSAVGLQKHSTGRICLLPGECWVPPELLALVTVFIRLRMSSLVSRFLPPHIFWPWHWSQETSWACFDGSFHCEAVSDNFLIQEGKLSFSICCYFPDALLWLYFNLLSRAMPRTNFRHFNSSRFYFTVSPKENSTAID